jgi:hypothetical protein
VKHRGEALQISQRPRQGYCLKELCEAMGVGPAIVSGWLRRGLLGKVRKHGGLRASDEAVEAFLRRFPAEYDMRRVAQEWFKGVIFGRGSKAIDRQGGDDGGS